MHLYQLICALCYHGKSIRLELLQGNAEVRAEVRVGCQNASKAVQQRTDPSPRRTDVCLSGTRFK